MPTRRWCRTCTSWTTPEWAGDGLTIEAKCNYQLVLDNLMDLTHEEFVHGSSLGQAELSESEFQTRREADGSVTVERWMLDVEPPPFWLKNMRDKFPGFTGRVDRWQIIHYYAPSTICIDVGVARAGTGAPAERPLAGRERLRDEHDHA